MFKFATPIILIGIAVAGVFMFISPFYKEISDLKTKSVSYNEALDNSKSLEAERDKLVQKYNSIDLDNLTKLQKLLPDNVDNIRLILEIEGIALPYGMVLKDVKYNPIVKDAKEEANTNQQSEAVQGGITAVKTNNDYGIWDLEFSTQGSYSNFLNFIKDLEKNLRIVDISSITFSSDSGVTTGSSSNSSSDSYKYSFKIKTYWLKG